MKFWRLNWTLSEFLSSSNYSNHQSALKSPWKFWLALIIKCFPKVWQSPILLRLKNGGAFYVKEFMTLNVYKEVFVEKCYDYPALFEGEPLIIDIGANTGLFSLRMKQLYPDSQIYCFEPHALNFKQLSENVEASKLDNIELFQFGIGGVTRQEKLYANKENLSGPSIIPSEANSKEFTEVKLVSIKEMFESLKITKCNLLKIDSKGAEYEIIKSIDWKLANSIEKIIFEPSFETYSIEDLTSHLKSIGFAMINREGLCVAINTASFDALFEIEHASMVA